MRELLRRGSGPTFPFEVKSPKSARPVFWGLYLCSYLLDIPDVEKKNEQEKFGGNRHAKIVSPGPAPISACSNTSES